MTLYSPNDPFAPKELYTNQIKQKVQELMAFKPYPDLKFAIAEYPNMLTVRVWESNIVKYDERQYQIILEFLWKVRNTIRSFGVVCEIEGVADVTTNV